MSEFSGILRERVTFQTSIDVPDGHGGSARVWAAMDSVWAHVDVQDVSERLVAGRIRLQQKYLILCRSGKNIDPAWRVEWRGTLMTITSVWSDPAMPDQVKITALSEREQ